MKSGGQQAAHLQLLSEVTKPFFPSLTLSGSLFALVLSHGCCQMVAFVLHFGNRSSAIILPVSWPCSHQARSKITPLILILKKQINGEGSGQVMKSVNARPCIQNTGSTSYCGKPTFHSCSKNPPKSPR